MHPLTHQTRLRNLAGLLAVLLLGAAGCQTLEVEVVDAPHARVVRHQKSFFVGGLFPRRQEVDVSTFCPFGVSRVREQTTADEFAVSLLTLGLWTPRTSWYYCLRGAGVGDAWMMDLPIPADPEPSDAPREDPWR